MPYPYDQEGWEEWYGGATQIPQPTIGMPWGAALGQAIATHIGTKRRAAIQSAALLMDEAPQSPELLLTLQRMKKRDPGTYGILEAERKRRLGAIQQSIESSKLYERLIGNIQAARGRAVGMTGPSGKLPTISLPTPPGQFNLQAADAVQQAFKLNAPTVGWEELGVKDQAAFLQNPAFGESFNDRVALLEQLGVRLAGSSIAGERGVEQIDIAAARAAGVPVVQRMTPTGVQVKRYQAGMEPTPVQVEAARVSEERRQQDLEFKRATEKRAERGLEIQEENLRLAKAREARVAAGGAALAKPIRSITGAPLTKFSQGMGAMGITLGPQWTKEKQTIVDGVNSLIKDGYTQKEAIDEAMRLYAQQKVAEARTEQEKRNAENLAGFFVPSVAADPFLLQINLPPGYGQPEE